MKKAKFILDRYEGDKAVLIYEGESLVVPAKFLKGAKEGSAVTITFEMASSDKDAKKVKRLLGEIFENNN